MIGLSLAEATEHIEYSLRDAGLLDSALARAHFQYDQSSVLENGLKIMIGVIKNHPYIDGNKRAGIRLFDAYLRKNNLRLAHAHIPQSDFETELFELVCGLAAGTKRIDDAYATTSRHVSPYAGTEYFGFHNEYPQLIERLQQT